MYKKGILYTNTANVNIKRSHSAVCKTAITRGQFWPHSHDDTNSKLSLNFPPSLSLVFPHDTLKLI